MRFTYLDILEQCFHNKFRGYNKQEVDIFLQLVADDFKEMSEEIEDLKKQSDKKNRLISKLENQLKEIGERNGNGRPKWEESLSATRQKAQDILQRAQTQVGEKCKNAEKELNRIREDIKLLKGERENLLDSLKDGAKDYLESLYKKKQSHAASDQKS